MATNRTLTDLAFCDEQEIITIQGVSTCVEKYPFHANNKKLSTRVNLNIMTKICFSHGFRILCNT